jgi:hypothetical protein
VSTTNGRAVVERVPDVRSEITASVYLYVSTEDLCLMGIVSTVPVIVHMNMKGPVIAMVNKVLGPVALHEDPVVTTLLGMCVRWRS